MSFHVHRSLPVGLCPLVTTVRYLQIPAEDHRCRLEAYIQMYKNLQKSAKMEKMRVFLVFYVLSSFFFRLFRFWLVLDTPTIHKHSFTIHQP
jgi:hypothetical protein